MRPEFIIHTPSFDDRVGGYVVLHALCARLTELGFEAAIWPDEKPGPLNAKDWRSIKAHGGYILKRKGRNFDFGPFSNLLATNDDLKEAIVVYPETVFGNPLGGDKVSRWFLHRPGYHSGRVGYDKSDLFFFFNEAFQDPAYNADLLRVTYTHPAYKQVNFGAREGSCYLVRKGKGRKLDQHPKAAILLDDLSHEDCAAILNRVEAAYIYDSHTYFAEFAAICGCTPIIIPDQGVPKEIWEPAIERRYGKAYGIGDISWAIETREKLLESLSKSRAAEDASVMSFVKKCREYFNRPR